MFKSKETWRLVLRQGVKAIERGLMWSDDFGRTYHSIIATSHEFIQFVKEGDRRDNAKQLTRLLVADAAKELYQKRKVKIGELFDDPQSESLFILLHPYVEVTKKGKYIKFKKKFRKKMRGC